MEEGRTVLHKSFLFSQRMVRLHKHLLANGQPWALADQLLRSGTSLSANLQETTGGFSKRDFVAKCSIAYKEARETHYWLRLLKHTDCLEPRLAGSLLTEAEELRRLLSAIVRTSKEPLTA
jgi:four helix bundle protein